MGRAQPQPPPSGLLSGLMARHDQALALITTELHRNTNNRQLVDVLLDVRNALRPPPRES